MQGGPRLLRQLTTINKANVDWTALCPVQPARANPGSCHVDTGVGRPVCGEMRKGEERSLLVQCPSRTQFRAHFCVSGMHWSFLVFPQPPR
jgi:hypothetical protein